MKALAVAGPVTFPIILIVSIFVVAGTALEEANRVFVLSLIHI